MLYVAMQQTKGILPGRYTSGPGPGTGSEVSGPCQSGPANSSTPQFCGRQQLLQSCPAGPRMLVSPSRALKWPPHGDLGQTRREKILFEFSVIYYIIIYIQHSLQILLVLHKYFNNLRFKCTDTYIVLNHRKMF